MVPVPDESARADITARLDSLASALEQHPQWTPPNPHPALLQLWDFVKRSHYIMTELENIRTGRPLKHPDQIPPHEDGKSASSWFPPLDTDLVLLDLVNMGL
jgi:predicted transcriptional regulator